MRFVKNVPRPYCFPRKEKATYIYRTNVFLGRVCLKCFLPPEQKLNFLVLARNLSYSYHPHDSK